jgi:hypothetical protein
MRAGRKHTLRLACSEARVGREVGCLQASKGMYMREEDALRLRLDAEALCACACMRDRDDDAWACQCTRALPRHVQKCWHANA